MLELYVFTPSTRALGVIALADHLGIDYQMRSVDLGAGDQLSSDYRTINPNTKVPALRDGDFTLWESNAILFYLASHQPESEAWPREIRVQADVMRWLAWQSAHWDAESCGMVAYELGSKRVLNLGPPEPAFLERGGQNFVRFAAVLDAHLDGRRWIVGEGLTIADFSIGALVPTARRFELPLGDFPAIERWYDRLSELPAWASAVARRNSAIQAWLPAAQSRLTS